MAYAEGMAERLLARAGDDRPALLFGDDTWSWREFVAAASVRAAVAASLRREGPFHIGVLLENEPEYLFWLAGAAFAGAAIVGINPTRRGAELEQWAAVKKAASEAIVANGATITHHHAVGRDHAPYMAAEVGETGLEVLRAMKERLDPAGIMNPGKLLP